MPTIPKIQASLYAIGKRLQGYHLLKNPKGTSQTEVNMIKQNFYGTTQLWDDIFHIKRVRANFSEGETEHESKFLRSTHYFDEKAMYMTKPRKKNIYFSIRKNGEYVDIGERQDLAWEQDEKRTAKKLSYKRSGFLECNSEYDIMCRTKTEAEHNRGYYKKHYPLIVKIISLGMHKRMLYPQENRPNFFKILYQNLTNK